jgi:pilus assembly protein CpaE
MVAFVGARGGVGTTTVATNLALYLAEQQRRRVLLLDLDLQNGDCALALNLAPTPGLLDALANPLRIDNVFLDRAMAAHGERLFVLSAEEPLGTEVQCGVEAIEILVGALRTQFHYIIADIPRLARAPYRRSLEMADIRVIVADQTLRSVRDTLRLQAVLGESNAAHRNVLIVNRSGETGRHAITLGDMGKVGLHSTLIMPFRPKQFHSARLPRRGKFFDAIAALALEISGRPPERTPWWKFSKW